MTSTLRLWLTVLLALPAPAGSGGPPADTAIGPGNEVPFVAQSGMLCGGAAAAMLERFWGARGVYATDFARLVHPAEGGIRTVDLARALEARGLDVSVRSGDPGIGEAALRRGLPVMLLIGSGGKRRHYVVLISRSGDTARIHDPNWGPNRPLAWTALEKAWRPRVTGPWWLPVDSLC